MKVCSIVGIRKSGKTTVVTELVQELKKRGYKVGTVKTVFCPTFSLDNPKSNSARHKKAGADIVCIRAKNETDLIIPRGIEDNVILPQMEVDYLLLEGDYEADVPRIICAHKEEEILERLTDKTFGVSGRIADKIKGFKDLPVVHVLEDPGRLADLVEAQPDVTFPISYLEPLGSVQAFCQCGCHKNEKKMEAVAEAAEGAREEILPYTRDRSCKHIFLTGEKQVGKSTLIKRLMEEEGYSFKGFQTRVYELEGVKKGYYMHSILPMESLENDSPISINICENKAVPILETFNTLGVRIVTEAMSHPGIMVMDELGRFEGKAGDFRNAIMASLNMEKQVIGVLQRTHSDFIDQIKVRDDVEVIEINRDNRDHIYDTLRGLLCQG